MDAHHPKADTDTMLTPFHIAFPVDDIAAARHFYGMVLGCAEDRRADTWIDFDLFGHQIVAHYKQTVRKLRLEDSKVFGCAVSFFHGTYSWL